jgi:hypothetical protein
MAGYNDMHCKHVVEANILQQAYGVATINHLGSTNVGNNFEQGDCTWANGRNSPVNVESDARHPNRLGHDENFYAFPPIDLTSSLQPGCWTMASASEDRLRRRLPPRSHVAGL